MRKQSHENLILLKKKAPNKVTALKYTVTVHCFKAFLFMALLNSWTYDSKAQTKKLQIEKSQLTNTAPVKTHKKFKLKTIAFYNLENLFDTIDHPDTFDEDRTPKGKDRWTQKKFNHKISQLAWVIERLGNPMSTYQKGPDILGVCEVENQGVLEILVRHKLLRNENYQIIHKDAPDKRGIDVALVYKPSAFIVDSFNSHSLYLYDRLQKRKFTRDQLVVMGYLDGEPLWIIVNHWPSRSGGTQSSSPFRIKAALLNLRIIDSIRGISPEAKIISMGDFNDGPTDPSFKKVLQTIPPTTRHKKTRDSSYYKLINPMESLFKKGIGSLAYRDQWSLFDQFYLSDNWFNEKENNYVFKKVAVFNHPKLITKKGRYKGYPFRSYSAGQYQGGFSDHFPVQLFIAKEIQ
tara:strand:+ start:1860 stop:3074 length:1215 start_codon:yes stop_codon:yes gene_type:complete